METCKLLVWMHGALLASTSAIAVAADVPAHVPQTENARLRAELVARVERAIKGYVSACAGRDADGLAAVTTSDLRMEFPLGEPGTWFGADATALLELCGSAARSGDSPIVENLWVFPTADDETVFVQYDAPVADSGPGNRRQLVLVTMRGERIARITSFSEMPPTLLARIVPRPGESRTARADDAPR